MGRDRPRVAILPALVCSTMLTFVLGGLGNPHESTRPRRTRASEGVDANAEFFAAVGGGGWRGAVGGREWESVQGERARGESASLYFLRGSGFLRKLQAAKQHQGCTRRAGLAARARWVPSHVPDYVFLVCLLILRRRHRMCIVFGRSRNCCCH